MAETPSRPRNAATKPPTRADVVGLAQQVGGLASDVQGLTHTIATVQESAATAKKTADNLAQTTVSSTDASRTVKRILIGVLVAVVISTIFSIVTTSALVSRCFLKPPQHGFGKTLCDAIPGYKSVEKEATLRRDQTIQLGTVAPLNRNALIHLYHVEGVPVPKYLLHEPQPPAH